MPPHSRGRGRLPLGGIPRPTRAASSFGGFLRSHLGRREPGSGSRASPQPVASLLRGTLRRRASALALVRWVQAGARAEAAACGCSGCGGGCLVLASPHAGTAEELGCSSPPGQLSRRPARLLSFSLCVTPSAAGAWASCHPDLGAIWLLFFLKQKELPAFKWGQ